VNANPLALGDLAASVWAVPPLARRADLALTEAENRKLIRRVEASGIRTLLYGGNANFYHVPLSEYGAILEFLAEAAGPGTWVIPPAGPDYGRLMDQAAVLRGLPFPLVMVLPAGTPATPPGTATGLRRFAERLGRPLTLYLRSEEALRLADVRVLVDDGLVSAIKYAIVRSQPGEDAFLAELVQQVDPRRVLSVGERAALAHLRRFGLSSFTSGAACLAPRAASALLAALQSGDYVEAERLRAAFLPLEDLRDSLNAIRVIHDAVTLAGIADMGPILPLLHNLEAEERPAVERAVADLLAFEAAL
jgi:dihydrodipicolinate synthase/N-acetylneuraminate lyase